MKPNILNDFSPPLNLEAASSASVMVTSSLPYLTSSNCTWSKAISKIDKDRRKQKADRQRNKESQRDREQRQRETESRDRERQRETESTTIQNFKHDMIPGDVQLPIDKHSEIPINVRLIQIG